MFLQWLWFGMMFCSIFYACITGTGAQMLAAALDGVGQAVELTFRLSAGYMFFGGLMEIVSGAGVTAALERLMRPILSRLMPCMGSAAEKIALNLSANMLGLGNAATPVGLEAMRMMEVERQKNPRVRHDMYLFLIINATSLQLLPTTVLTLRMAAGSSAPNAILLPTLACTALSMLVGITLGLLARRMEEKRYAQ